MPHITHVFLKAHQPVTAPTDNRYTLIMASLQFQRTYSKAGFSDPTMSSSQGIPETVIRELLQNSLDATLARQKLEHNSSISAEVVFTIAEHSQLKIPGIAEYKKAFESAKHTRSQGRQGDDEKRIIRSIDQVLCSDKVRILFCCDNGIGLDQETITSLLWEGNTDKYEGQAGAFGLGHIYPFQASDLRYILYAGRCKNGTPTAEIFSGHTRLAAHPDLQEETRSEHGHFVESFPSSHNQLPEYSGDIPDLLAPYLPAAGTGTVVCMLGFNDFEAENRCNTAEEILKAAGKNFFAAIYAGDMAVKVVDEIVDRSKTLDKQQLPALMSTIASEKRSKRSGFLAGSRAHEAYITLQQGKVIDVADAKVVIRPIEAYSRNKRHEISLCRNGMWITREVPECDSSNFSAVQPFNAVILLNDKKGELHTLIRKAEGPEHRDIQKQRLSNEEKSKLTTLLRKIAEAISKEVGEIEGQETFRPQGFATFFHSELKEASQIRQIHNPGSDTRGKSRGKSGKRKNRKKKSKKERPPQPRPGSTLPIRSSLRPRMKGNNTVTEILARCSFADQDKQLEFTGVRIYRPSGSDESCELPVNASYVKLAGITIEQTQGTDTFYLPTENGIEVIIPATSNNLTITLAEAHAMDDTAAFKVELFPRKSLTESKAKPN